MTASRSPIRTDGEDGGTMSFLEHLDDLRTRLIHSCLALAVGTGLAFLFMEPMVGLVMAPTHRVLRRGTQLIFSRPTEGISVYLDVAFMAGLVLAAPMILYQAWLFVAPALYANEKRFVIPFGARG